MKEGAGSPSPDLMVHGEHAQGRHEPEKRGMDLRSCRRCPRIRGAGCRLWARADGCILRFWESHRKGSKSEEKGERQDVCASVSYLFMVGACLKKKVCLSFCPADCSVCWRLCCAPFQPTSPHPPSASFPPVAFPLKDVWRARADQVGRGLCRWWGDSTPALSIA